MINSLQFGDVFRFREKEYIFLASSEDVLYAAKILGTTEGSNLENYCSRAIAQNKPSYKSAILFCYITLKTSVYEGRLAFFGTPAFDGFIEIFEKLPIQLDDTDLQSLKQEIVDSRALPIGLRELLKNVELISN